MDRRFALFAVLVALIFIGNQIVFSLLFPPEPVEQKPADKQVAAAEKDKQQPQADKKDAPQADIQAAPDQPAEEQAPGAAEAEQDPEQQPAPQPVIPQQRGALGSLDHSSPFRMAVFWNNRGASVEAVVLNSPAYRALDDRTGDLGYLAPIDAPKRGGARVRVVAPGTPAAVAGIQPDDVITSIGETRVRTVGDLLLALQETRPDQQIDIEINRAGAGKKLSATLGRPPLEVIRPEFDTKPVDVVKPGEHDPLSFLATLRQFDERALPDDDKHKELGGVNLRDSTWQVVQADHDVVRFKKSLPKLGLEITKTFRLAEVPKEELANPNFPAYGLTLELQVANVSDEPHEVAYRLDGPTGLPIEGAWYASKVSHTWGAAGLRDVIVQFNGGRLDQVAPSMLAEPDPSLGWGGTASLDYIAVDAQYFSAAVIPRKQEPTEVLFERVVPIRAGAVPEEKRDIRLMNVSFRLDSKPATLAPGATLEHKFDIFAGPKRPELLSQYGQPGGSLADLVYYGWFGVVARPMLVVLHFFYSIVANYGLAIILLTVLVRGCMFPLSRKQVQGAQKMQELQPEMKRISEKYKTEPEKRTKATQELFRKHNYNPVGGCLLMFVQLPVFMGLYRSLMVDVELRQAPLISQSIRWASNLSAPDMLWNWTGIVPDFIVYGAGIFPALGPYLNILPLITISFFIWQQKMFMPPPADEQAAMQQKMMKYMMIFMGILFFKVASGLCVYFIASSLWGVCERKLLPKPAPKPAAGGDGTSGSPAKAQSPGPGGNGAPTGKKKKRQRGRR